MDTFGHIIYVLGKWKDGAPMEDGYGDEDEVENKDEDDGKNDGDDDGEDEV